MRIRTIAYICFAVFVTGCLNDGSESNNTQIDDLKKPAKNEKLQAKNEKEQGLVQYGMILPRPVDRELRKAYGFSEPRSSRIVLKMIDELNQQMRSISQTDENWKKRFREYRQMQRRRITLISELEESGYQQERLKKMLEVKLADLGSVWNRSQGAVASYASIREELAKNFEGTDIGNSAEWSAMLEKIQFITINKMHIAKRDFQRIAELELQMPDPKKSGVLLLEALHFCDDDEFKNKWYDWIINNLSAKTKGYRYVMKKRMFGSPIRLKGDALRGGNIDTGDWKGDVILVDFWGMWCVPCKAAMPQLKLLQKKYGDQGLRLVGVLVDHEFEKARTYLRDKKFSWPQIIWTVSTPENFHDHPIAQEYAVGSFPTLWLIDRQGIVHEVAREDLESTIVSFLSK